jgi:hypothetical protein
MSFRIGRKFAQHVYPESRASQSLPFARNSAFGPAPGAPLVGDTPGEITWSTVESGGGASVSVPITPRVTGIVLVTGVIQVANTTDDGEELTVQLGVGGVLHANPLEGNQVAAAIGFVTTVPIQAILGLPIGTPSLINVFVTANVTGELQLQAHNSWLTLQEVGPATG